MRNQTSEIEVPHTNAVCACGDVSHVHDALNRRIDDYNEIKTSFHGDAAQITRGPTYTCGACNRAHDHAVEDAAYWAAEAQRRTAAGLPA